MAFTTVINSLVLKYSRARRERAGSMHFLSLFTRAECVFKCGRIRARGINPDSIENGILHTGESVRPYSSLIRRAYSVFSGIHGRAEQSSLKFTRATRNRLSSDGMYYSLHR